MARKKKADKEPQSSVTAAPRKTTPKWLPADEEAGQPGYKSFWLRDEQRVVVHNAILFYAQAVEKSKKADEKIPVPTTEHRRLLRLIGGSDTVKGIDRVFAPADVASQGDTFYDEQVPYDTDVRDALTLAGVRGTNLHLIATLTGEQKREAMEWAKTYVEKTLSGVAKDKLPPRPAFVTELFPLPEHDPLLEGIDEEFRDGFVQALSDVIGKPSFVTPVPEDGELETTLAFHFEEIHKKTTMGFFKIGQITCYVAGGTNPLFAYGVNPDTYGTDRQAENPPLGEVSGKRLRDLARKLLALPDPTPVMKQEVAGEFVQHPDGFEEVEEIRPPLPEEAETVRKRKEQREREKELDQEQEQPETHDLFVVR